MSIPHLTLSKTGRYGYRRAVPEALREAVGQIEVKKSLGSDRTKAMKAYAKVHDETERMFEAAKNASQRTTPLTEREEVLKVLRKFATPKQLEAIAKGLDWPIDMEGPWYDMVRDHEEDEAQGKDPKISLATIRAIGAQKLPPVTYTVASALKLYEAGKMVGDVAKDKRNTNRIGNLRTRLEEVLGKDAVHKKPLETLRRADALKARDALMAELEPTSVRRMFNILRAAINQTIREYDLDAKNPWQNLDIKGAAASREDRMPFTEDDMKTLAPVMVKGPEDVLGILWTVLRDTGARNSEICPRRVSDIDFDNASVSLPLGKGKNAKRTVPLSPSALAGLTFLAKDKAPDDYLFSSYATGRLPDSASQALMKRLRTAITDNKKVVYSLRHRLKDRLRDTDCPADIQEEIMGHDAQNVAKNYGRGYSLEKKREYLARVWDGTPS